MVDAAQQAGWSATRAAQFDAWRAAHPDINAHIAELRTRTAALAADRQADRRGAWSRMCAADAERSAKLGDADRARIAGQIGEADKLKGAADWAGAAALYETVLRADPANREANCSLGECRLRTGDLAGAWRSLSIAASYPTPGTDNGYFRTMFLLQKLPVPPDPALREPPVLFRVPGAPDEVWDAPTAPLMTIIPGGEYTMGSLEDEPLHVADETPHRVTLAYPLAVSRGDVTVGEFAAFVAATGYDAETQGDCQAFHNGAFTSDPDANWRKPGFDQTPDEAVVCVSYFDGVAYCRWLSETTGHTYRIPSEAEWEYAVRGGTTGSHWWGGDEVGIGNANCDGGAAGGPHHKPTPAGTFPANPFGLYDVVGNVWKWVEDAWNPDYVGAPDDGSAWLDGTTVLKGRRGGSWFNVSEARPGDYRAPFRLRSAARFGSLPHLRFSSFGLRVVRDL